MTTRQFTSAWRRLEEVVPSGGYISLSGPFSNGYNVAVFDGTSEETDGGRVSYPLGRGHGATPVAALQDTFRNRPRESSLGRDTEGHLVLTLGPGAESPSRKEGWDALDGLSPLEQYNREGR